MSLRGGTTKQTRRNASVESVNLRRDCFAIARNDK
ncbi:MAG: hypothetical protein JWP94_866 [Mucilaginibacter sp.]|nr:hypothetical protein [Mucilaginibacter sp.]